MTDSTRLKIMRIGFAALAAVLLAVGIIARDPSRVWTKAAKICLECIGLG